MLAIQRLIFRCSGEQSRQAAPAAMEEADTADGEPMRNIAGKLLLIACTGAALTWLAQLASQPEREDWQVTGSRAWALVAHIDVVREPFVM
jgi:hypothetical protein